MGGLFGPLYCIAGRAGIYDALLEIRTSSRMPRTIPVSAQSATSPSQHSSLEPQPIHIVTPPPQMLQRRNDLVDALDCSPRPDKLLRPANLSQVLVNDATGSGIDDPRKLTVFRSSRVVATKVPLIALDDNGRQERQLSQRRRHRCGCRCHIVTLRQHDDAQQAVPLRRVPHAHLLGRQMQALGGM